MHKWTDETRKNKGLRPSKQKELTDKTKKDKSLCLFEQHKWTDEIGKKKSFVRPYMFAGRTKPNYNR